MPNPTIHDYITQVRRLLHDENRELYPGDGELADYINSARRQVAEDMHGLTRVIQFTMPNGQEALDFEWLEAQVRGTAGYDLVLSVASGSVFHDVNYRPPLTKVYWSLFDAYFRTWKVSGSPSHWSQEGRTFYVYPKPNRDYQIEAKVVCLPSDKPDTDATADVLGFPDNEAVKWLAASFAFPKDKAYQESDWLMARYQMRRREILAHRHFPSVLQGRW